MTILKRPNIAVRIVEPSYKHGDREINGNFIVRYTNAEDVEESRWAILRWEKIRFFFLADSRNANSKAKNIIDVELRKMICGNKPRPFIGRTSNRHQTPCENMF